MTTDKFNGDLLVIYADGVKVAHTIDATLSVSQDLPDATTKDSAAWVDHVKGNRSFEVSGSGLAAFDASMGVKEMIAAMVDADTVSMRFTTNVAGDTEYRGQVSVSSTSFSAPQNSPAGFDFTFTGKGALTIVTIT